MFLVARVVSLLGLLCAPLTRADIPCIFRDPVSGHEFDLTSLRKSDAHGYVTSSFTGGIDGSTQTDFQLNFCAVAGNPSVSLESIQTPCDIATDKHIPSSINQISQPANRAGVNGSSTAPEKAVCDGYLADWNDPDSPPKVSALLSDGIPLGVQLTFDNGIVAGCAHKLTLNLNVWCGNFNGISAITVARTSWIPNSHGQITTGNNADCVYEMDFRGGNFIGCPINLGRPTTTEDFRTNTSGYVAGMVVLAVVGLGAGITAFYFWNAMNKQMKSFALGVRGDDVKL